MRKSIYTVEQIDALLSAKGVVFQGAYVSVDDVATPVEGGHYYIGTEGAYDVYSYINGAWVNAGPFRGPKGDPFTYEDFTQEQLDALESGAKAAQAAAEKAAAEAESAAQTAAADAATDAAAKAAELAAQETVAEVEAEIEEYVSAAEAAKEAAETARDMAQSIAGGLPGYTSDDEGKFLRIVDGAAAWATVQNAEEASF